MTHKPNPKHLPPAKSADEYERELAALRARVEWQPMDAMPDTDERVLLYSEVGCTLVQSSSVPRSLRRSALGWMPLPTPPASALSPKGKTL